MDNAESLSTRPRPTPTWAASVVSTVVGISSRNSIRTDSPTAGYVSPPYGRDSSSVAGPLNQLTPDSGFSNTSTSGSVFMSGSGLPSLAIDLRMPFGNISSSELRLNTTPRDSG